MRWVKFTDSNGGRRVFGNDKEGGIFYQRADGSWNRLNHPDTIFRSPEQFITFIETAYHLGVKGFSPAEERGGWD